MHITGIPSWLWTSQLLDPFWKWIDLLSFLTAFILCTSTSNIFFGWVGLRNIETKNRLISHVMVEMINWKQEPSRLLQLSVLPFSYLVAGWTMAVCRYKPSQNVLTLIHFIKLRWPKLSRCEWRCWELRAATLMGWTVQQDVTHGLTGHWLEYQPTVPG